MSSTLRRRALPIAASCAALAVAALPLAAPAGAADGPAAVPARDVVVSRADAQQEAAAVTAEDRRITALRTVSSVARWQGHTKKVPYRTSTSSGYTLVLTPRAQPYTVDDLLKLAPQTFLRMSDGGFLLTEHIVVTAGATLHLARPGGLTLRLSSSSRGFVTVISMGGRIEFAGEQGAPIRLTSWDVDAGVPDRDVRDGRAYVRAIGGQLDASYLQASLLGFWSGRTGGIALTGTDRPNTGAIEPLRGDVADPSVPSALDGVTTQPAGPLKPGQTNPGTRYTVPSQSYVSSRLTNTSVDGNAYGLFVSGANGIQITSSMFRNSRIAGVVLHRFVSNGVISKTSSSDNAGSGFTLDRATTGITISQATASRNAANGITVSGRSLADGPSVTGSTTSSYGGNSVANSTLNHNGRYGIHVTGGFNIGVQNNHLSGNDMGIVVTGPANRVSVTGNQVHSTRRHAVALEDGVTASTVTGNVVDGAATGVYVRDSVAQVTGNTIEAARSHGVSLVGRVSGSQVAYNVLAGHGASAFDSNRSAGVFHDVQNQVNGWHDTTPWYYVFKRLLHPMNALWLIIFGLLLLSALRSRRNGRVVAHPYAHQMEHRQMEPVGTLPEPETIDLRDDRTPSVAAR